MPPSAPVISTGLSITHLLVKNTCSGSTMLLNSLSLFLTFDMMIRLRRFLFDSFRIYLAK